MPNETNLRLLTTNEYTTLPELLVHTNGEKTPLSLLAKEFAVSQTIGADLPIKIASDRTEDKGRFIEPWEYDAKSDIKTIGEGANFYKEKTYGRKDIMGMRKSAIAIDYFEHKLQGAMGDLWRATQAYERVSKMGLDVEHDMFYGDPRIAEREGSMLGLMPRFSQITDMDGKIVTGANAGKLARYITLDAGGTADGSLASVMLVYPNQKKGVSWLVPGGDTMFTGGIEYEPGEFQTMVSTGADGRPEAIKQAIDLFSITGGVGMLNRQAAIRIANVDYTTDAGMKKLVHCLYLAMEAVEPEIAAGFIAYVPRTLKVALKEYFTNKVQPATYENAKIRNTKGDFMMDGINFRSVYHLTDKESKVV